MVFAEVLQKLVPNAIELRKPDISFFDFVRDNSLAVQVHNQDLVLLIVPHAFHDIFFEVLLGHLYAVAKQ